MSPEEQRDYREARREETRTAWRRADPARAARRDAIVAEAIPQPCDSCGSDAGLPFVIDYEQAVVVWRCRGCAKVAREAFLRAA